MTVLKTSEIFIPGMTTSKRQSLHIQPISREKKSYYMTHAVHTPKNFSSQFIEISISKLSPQTIIQNGNMAGDSLEMGV
jgi:hypothetical protein